MRPIIYDQLEQGTDEWLQARCGIVTASVVGQLISPKTRKPANNDTSRSLIRSLVAERITGQPADQAETWDMRRGHIAEPYARDLYEQNYQPVDQVGFVVRDFPGLRIGCSPDGLIGDNAVLEIKSPRAKTHLQTLVTDEVPAWNLAQVHAALLVTDRDYLDFVSYFPSMPLYVRRVERDETWDQAIIDAVAAAEDQADVLMDQYRAAAQGRPPTPWIDFWEEEEVSLSL